MKHLGREKRMGLKNKIIKKIRRIFICKLKEIKIPIINVIMRLLKLLHQFSKGVNY